MSSAGPRAHRRAMAPDLETIVDTLPRRYRAVLDAVDRVERDGARIEACRWREQAIERYSRRWDTATLRWFDATLGKIAAYARERAQAAVVAASAGTSGRDDLAA